MGEALGRPDLTRDMFTIAGRLGFLRDKVNFLGQQVGGLNDKELNAAATIHSLTQGRDAVSTDRLMEIVKAIKAAEKKGG